MLIKGSLNKKGCSGRGPGGIWRPPSPSWVAPSPSPWAYSWEQPSGDREHRQVSERQPAGGSPVAVEALQLPLHRAADAAAVGAVQPGAHHAQPVVPLLPVEGKVLHLGGDALPAFGGGRRGSAGLLPGEDGSLSRVPSPPPSHEGGPGGTCDLGKPSTPPPTPGGRYHAPPGGLSGTHRGTCSGETGEAECGIPRK